MRQQEQEITVNQARDLMEVAITLRADREDCFYLDEFIQIGLPIAAKELVQRYRHGRYGLVWVPIEEEVFTREQYEERSASTTE